MKFIFKTIATILGVIVLLLGFVFFFTGGMTRVAEDYFIAVNEEQQEQANRAVPRI